MRERSSHSVQASGSAQEPPARPTPVRAVMGSADPADDSAGGSSPPVIEIADDRWIAQAIGSTRSGTAPLLLVAFSRVDEPDVFVREALGVAESLADLGSHDLEELFARSRPYRAQGVPGGDAHGSA